LEKKSRNRYTRITSILTGLGKEDGDREEIPISLHLYPTTNRLEMRIEMCQSDQIRALADGYKLDSGSLLSLSF